MRKNGLLLETSLQKCLQLFRPIHIHYTDTDGFQNFLLFPS